DRTFDAGGVQAAFGKHAGRLVMLDVNIRQAEVEHRNLDALGQQPFVHRAAGAAHDGVLLDRDQQPVTVGQLAQQFGVQRLDEAHVGHGGVQRVGSDQRVGVQGAEAEDGDVPTPAGNQALADGQGRQRGVDRYTRAGVAVRAYSRRAVVEEAGGQQMARFVVVRRGNDQKVGDAAQVAQVEAGGMGRAVFADQAGAVDGKEPTQILYRHVVDQLV